MCSNVFCLGEPWCSAWGRCKSDDSEMEDFQESKAKEKKLEVAGPSWRFADPLSPLKMQRICEGFVPKNMQKATDWKMPFNSSWNPDVGALNYWLPRFVFEVRWADGEQYPASSLVNILSGLYRYSKKCAPACPNFMEQRDPTFCKLSAMHYNYMSAPQLSKGSCLMVTCPREETLQYSEKCREWEYPDGGEEHAKSVQFWWLQQLQCEHLCWSRSTMENST